MPRSRRCACGSFFPLGCWREVLMMRRSFVHRRCKTRNDDQTWDGARHEQFGRRGHLGMADVITAVLNAVSHVTYSAETERVPLIVGVSA
jgi:hypothetical protein